MRNILRLLSIAALGLLPNAAPAASLTAIEYFHGADRHYFVTVDPLEVAALDGGAPAGWSRTGESFTVYDLDTAGAQRVCRFWSGASFAPKSSHFYTASADECALLKSDPVWRYEGEVFALNPSAGEGVCVPGALPLYRLYNGNQGGAPNHRYTTRPAIRAEMLAQGWVAEGVGAGVVGCVPPSAVQQTIRGCVIDGPVANALVCLDSNRNGRCEAAEAQGRTDAQGFYLLTVPRDAPEPLVAEVVAGESRDIESPQEAVDISYRMASPSLVYGVDITPFTTLVHLTGLANYALAEDLVRADLGLPPGFDLAMSPPPAPGTLKHSVARWVVRALKANGLVLDLAAPDALATVVGSFSTALTNLPQLAITTRDGAPIVSRETYVDATYVLTNPAGAVSTLTLNGKIRGRGNSTWGQPKNPYKVQFTNDASYATATDVLGMRKQRNWALLADYFDRSLMRNKLALSLGASSVFNDGLKWTPSGQHVEVWLNGDYVGIYLLTEDIRIDPARLPIRKMSADPAAGETSGGYIVEVDFRLDCYRGDDLDLQVVTPQNVPICVDTPDEEAITPAQLAYVRELVLAVERDLYGPLRLDRIHAASFADWYLLQELFRNNDAMFISSDFMWKDSDAAARPQDRLLNMGPIWDFDRAAGNVNYNDNWQTQGCWVSKGYQPNWFSRLFDDPDFVALTLARWNAKRPALEKFLNASIDTYARRLRNAQLRNFQRWPIFGLSLTNYYSFADHDEEVAFVRRFLNERMAWLDQAYASPEAFAAMCK